MRTKPPAFYISPSKREMDAAAEALGLEKYPRDLIQDMSNIAAGGEILPSAKYRHKVAKRIGPGPKDNDGDYSYYNLKGEAKYTKDPQLSKRHRINRKLLEHENTTNFIKTLDFDQIPGLSPLQQSMTIFKMLCEQNEDHTGNSKNIPENLKGDESKPQNQAEKFNNIFKQINKMTDIEKELMGYRKEPDNGAGKEKSDPNTQLKQAMLANDMLKGKEIWLKVSRQLDRIVKMKTAKSNETEPNPEGDDIHHRPIKGFHEIHKLPATEYTIPKSYRMYKIATQATQIRERIIRTDKVQLLYIIIDCSGSMENEKIHKAGGILMNRLKAVMKEEAVVYARFFDTELFKEHFADTPKTAKELIKHFQKENFNGGGTDITKCVKSSIKRIDELLKENQNLIRPELVVITDGEDSINLTKNDFGKTRMHSFLVNAHNETLSEIAIKTGGIGISL